MPVQSTVPPTAVGALQSGRGGARCFDTPRHRMVRMCAPGVRSCERTGYQRYCGRRPRHLRRSAAGCNGRRILLSLLETRSGVHRARVAAISR